MKRNRVPASQLLMFGQEDSPAKTFHSQEGTTSAEASEVSSLDSSTISLRSSPLASHLSSLSKTLQAFSLPTEEEISKSLFARWPTSGMAWRGECLTAVISESPSLANESLLLPAIETENVPERYFLSQNAAKGIMRRADKLGRTLFPPLRKSLEMLAKDQ